MSYVWALLVALWKIICWWAKRDEITQAKRKVLNEEVDRAIETGDTRELNRLLSRL